MRIYFDTNIYSYIGDRHEAAQVAQFLSSRRCRLIASAENLFELFAIPDEKQRRAEVQNLVKLATEFEQQPMSWLHARELRFEIRRLRPKWLLSIAFTREAKNFLKGHQRNWRNAIEDTLPPSSAYAVFRREFEHGVEHSREAQKQHRADMLKRNEGWALVNSQGGVIPVDAPDPEVYWRVEALQAWYNAIELESLASRDYADWLRPHLRRHCFQGQSYSDFWLKDASSDALPLNRLVGLLSFYQLQQKITHGNATDTIHAGQWLRSDLFLTADRGFHSALTAVARNHFPDQNLPHFINRGSPSFLQQFEALLADGQSD